VSVASEESSQLGPAGVLAGVTLGAAVAVPTFDGGGFDDSSRAWFVLLAGASLVVAAAFQPAGLVAAGRSRLARSLFALGLLSVVSAVWTVGSASAAVRWGLVIVGYGVIVIVARSFTARAGPWPVAIGIAVLAMAEALLGLDAVARHVLPDAERLVKTWRPGGSFEYPPALALLMVGALPILEAALRKRSLVAGALGAAGLTLAGSELGLSDSRLSIALAAVVMLALGVRGRASRERWPTTAAGAVLAIVGAVLSPAVLGGAVGRHAHGAGVDGTLAIVAISVGGGLVWAGIRTAAGGGRRVPAALACLAGVALIATMAVAVHPPSPRHHHRARHHHHRRSPAVPRPAPPGNFLHGRSHQWLAALDTWLDRPILGAGADAYYIASARHQTVDRSRYAHDLPLELAAELGILGLLLAISLYGTAIAEIIRERSGPAFWLLAPFVAAFLVSNLVDWTWHLAGLGAIWAACAGALGAPTNSERRASRS
jgi:O-Antigen ligase